VGTAGDARAVSEGIAAVRARVRALFTNRNTTIASEDGGEFETIDRISRQIMSGQRSFEEVRGSIDWRARQEDGGRPGGLDVTREGEDTVRELAAKWLGPSLGEMSDRQVSRWAGLIRNDPDAQQEFEATMRQQRLAMLPGYTNQNLTYEDIV